MKSVLLVSNQRNKANRVGNPVILRMQHALSSSKRMSRVEFEPFCNSFKSLCKIRRIAKKYDIIHVHFGGMYALLVRLCLLGLKKKYFITFHGTDIHAKSLKTTKSKLLKLKIILNQKASFISIGLYDKCGVVASEMMDYVPQIIKKKYHDKFFVQSLGVDYDTFKLMVKEDAQEKLKLSCGDYVLFSDIANTPIKRRDIATKIVESMGGTYKLLIMCGVSPELVPYYINASDFVLLTSDEEGSPNIIREALSLNKPVFSVNVGDASKQLEGLVNSKIISRQPFEAAQEIKRCLKQPYVDNTRQRLQQVLNFKRINESLIELYEKC